ncbi:protein SRG1 [Jatropha curcas]|uniref:protein SRG1 n=1 Tax=Jatropha curcas TaxID=180498 RepID=UPI0018948ECA|nr:protein SRG1 [Jatropha curcas]
MAAEIESMSKSVQKLAIDGKESLEKYIQKGTDSGKLNTSVPLIEVPIVDIGLLQSPLTRTEELHKLRSALSSWGFLQVINHGMTSSFLEKMSQVAKQFFSLPVEEKQKYYRETGSHEGYGNDMAPSEQKTLDWTDRLYLTLSPEDQRQLRFWPENPPAFREMLDEFAKKSQRIQEILLKEMARSLGLDDNCFLDQHGERPIVTAQFNYYPPCPMPGKTLGLRPHTDGSVLTILLQDKEVEGLQFLKDNQWFRVPIIPEALLVNVGDQAEIMSNGIFKSPIHRVVTNRERERISIADGLIDETRPRLYKTVKGYASFYTEYYQQGKRPIEAALI